MARKILIVDDEETLCETLRFNLEAEGYETATAHSAEEALALGPGGFDLVLLDVMMEGISGIQMARIMKANPATASVPVIFCTAKDTENDMVEGLELGADDYIVKPFSMRNVVARVRSVLRRCDRGAQSVDQETPLRHEGLELDPTGKRCTIDGAEVKLPRKEFEMLRLLMSHPGQIFSREEILDAVWPDEVVVADRVVDVNIARIRRKIGKYAATIVSRSGYGYAFAP